MQHRMECMSAPRVVFPRRFDQEQRRVMNLIARAILLNESDREDIYVPMVRGGLDPDPLSTSLKDAHDIMLQSSLKACELIRLDPEAACKHADVALLARREYRAVHQEMERRRLSPSGAYRGGVSKYFFFDQDIQGGKIVRVRKVFHLRLAWKDFKTKNSKLEVLNDHEILELSGVDVPKRAFASLGKFVQDGEKLLARLPADQLVFRQAQDAKTGRFLLRERDYVQRSYPELERALFALLLTVEYAGNVKLDDFTAARQVLLEYKRSLDGQFSS